MRMMTTVVAVAMAAASARAAFEKGGLADAPPRVAALGGADVATGAGRPDGAAGDLAWLSGPRAAGGYGAASAVDVATYRFGAGATVEGLGLGATYCRMSAGGRAMEQSIGLGLGVPIAEAGGAAFGARLKLLTATLGAEHATGAGLDVGAGGPLPTLPGGVEPRWGVALDDALGSLRWTGGLREDPSRQGRIGLAAGWRSLTGMAEARLIRGPAARENIWALGVEHRFAVRRVDLALRAGWRDGARREGTLSGGLAAGFGPAQLEYAVTGATRSQGYLHAVTLGWRPADSGAAPAPASRGRVRPGLATPDRVSWHPRSPYESLGILLAAPPGDRAWAWSVMVEDESGGVVWITDGEGGPPGRILWNGTTAGGELAPSGRYASRLILRGAGGWRYVSKPAAFRIERPAPARITAEPDGPGGF